MSVFSSAKRGAGAEPLLEASGTVLILEEPSVADLPGNMCEG
jgi:hypothetical protein